MTNYEIQLRDSIAKELFVDRCTNNKTVPSADVIAAGGIEKYIGKDVQVGAANAFICAETFIAEKKKRDADLVAGRDYIGQAEQS